MTTLYNLVKVTLANTNLLIGYYQSKNNFLQIYVPNTFNYEVERMWKCINFTLILVFFSLGNDLCVSLLSNFLFSDSDFHVLVEVIEHWGMQGFVLFVF